MSSAELQYTYASRGGARHNYCNSHAIATGQADCKERSECNKIKPPCPTALRCERNKRMYVYDTPSGSRLDTITPPMFSFLQWQMFSGRS